MSPRAPVPRLSLADVARHLPGWRERWIAAVRAFGWVVPAPRGRTVRLRIGRDGVAATVRAGGPPQHVSLRLAPVPPRTFDAAMRRLASRAAAAASLLAGRVPDDVERAFPGRHRLLPATPDDVIQSCSCGARDFCSHLAAVHASLAARLARDPLLLFELRGRNRDEVVAALRKNRALESLPAGDGAAPSRAAVLPAEEAPSPLPESVLARPETFFKPGLPLDSLTTSLAAADHPEAVLARLGPPPFADEAAARLLADLHRAIGLGAAERLSEWEWRRASGR